MDELIENSERTGLEAVVIGMAGRFPGASNLDEFWENLKNGVESISFFSSSELEEEGTAPEMFKKPNFIKAKGILEDIESFDSFFFDYTSREAEIMDPQIRIFHECAWEAFENAGYDPGNYEGLVGVYAGASANFSWVGRCFLPGGGDSTNLLEKLTLSDKDYLGMWISYKLNLHGPSISLRTTCSTSLVAIHLAFQGLVSGECDMALAGGVSISLPQKNGYIYQEGWVASPDGHCRAFDADAKGVMSGDGVGVVILKRLAEAIEDGDYLHAVVRGSTVNNDGIRKVGYTAPSVDGQTHVIAAALQVAEVEPESITYIEAHGTGTPLGDPIEMAALTHAFAASKKGFCKIGSVKTNLGHLDSAAGIAGFIKTVLALKHQLIPPNLHFQTPNPKIDFENSPFRVNTGLSRWKRNKYPLRAGVSSFGIGGTNAHVILEEAPQNGRSGGQWVSGSEGNEADDRGQGQGRGGVSPPVNRRPHQLILLSAKTETALEKMTRSLADYFKRNPDIKLEDASYTLQVGRKPFKYRKFLVAAGIKETVDGLNDPNCAEVYEGEVKENKPQVIFMFSGQGSQYVNMGLELYRKESVFRREMDRCFEILNPIMGYDLKDILYPPRQTSAPGSSSQAENSSESNMGRLYHQEVIQPVMFVFEYALARQLMHWGIQPYAMIGYSIGEYVAACLSGVFSLEDALAVVASRGRLMMNVPHGTMLSVPLPEEELIPLLKESTNITLAVDNGLSCIISGPDEAVKVFEGKLKKEKRCLCMRLSISHAGHSQMMDPILPEFRESWTGVKFQNPTIPYISTLTGTWITLEQATDPGYWTQHLRETVRFARGMTQLLKEKDAVFLEVGPRRSLSTAVMQHPDRKPGHNIFSLIKYPDQKVSDVYYLLSKIGQLWLYGTDIRWENLYPREKKRRIPLPTYSFDKHLYPVDIPSRQETMNGTAKGIPGKSLRKKPDIADWFYLPSWEKSPIPFSSPGEVGQTLNWLVFIDKEGIGALLVKCLEAANHRVITVRSGGEFKRETPESFVLDPTQEQGYHILFDELQESGQSPQRILHLWNVSRNTPGASLLEKVEEIQNLGFYSLIHIAQALGRKGITGNIRIKVVTSHMQEVTGEEELCPIKAAILGPVKIIPQEYSNLECSCVDIILLEPGERGSKKEARLVEHLLAELAADADGTANQVAIRGSHRWVKVFKPFRFEKPEGFSSQVVVSTTDLEHRIKQAAAPGALPSSEFLKKERKTGVFQSRPKLSTVYVSPRNQTEKVLAQIWGELLGIESIGVNDNFFEIGGDSLKAVWILPVIHEKLGIEMPISEIFTRPTISSMGEYIDRAARKSTYSAVEPSEKKEYYVSSSAQKRFYFLQQIDFNNMAFNVSQVVEVSESDLGFARVEKIFQELVKRHESFRTSFEIIDQNLVQRIHPVVDFSVEYFEIDKKEAREIIGRFIRPFDPGKAPLLRVGLISGNEGEYVLMVDMHHIISDGTSVEILLREFLTLCNSNQLVTLKIQYKDYSEWEDKEIRNESKQKQEQFWLKQFEDHIPVLNLPLDYPRPENRSYEGDVIPLRIGSDETSALKELALEEKVTLYIVLLAIFNVFLSKICGQEDIVIGAFIAGRRHHETLGIIGMFVNMLALRNFPGENRVFREFLQEVKERTIQAFNHQDYQFDNLVNKLISGRDPSRLPLAEVVIELRNMEGPEEEEINVKLKPHDFIKKTSNFELQLSGHEVRGTLDFRLSYSTKLFKKEKIERFAAFFKEIATCVIKDKNIKLKDIKIFHGLKTAKSAAIDTNVDFAF